MKLIPLLSLLALSTAAGASDFYLLGEFTHSKNTLGGNVFDSALSNAGATGLSSSVKGGSNQVRLQLGYKVNPNFALEGGYIDFGKAKYSSSYSVAGTPDTATGTVKAGGLDIAALGILPLGDSFSLFGKAGLVAARVKSTLASGSGVAGGSASSNVLRPLLGVGVSYKLNENMDLRGEYDHVSGLGKSSTTGKMNDNMLSFGLGYHF